MIYLNFEAPPNAEPQNLESSNSQKTNRGTACQDMLAEEADRIIKNGPVTKKPRGRPRKDPTDPKWAAIDKIRRAQAKNKKNTSGRAWKKKKADEAVAKLALLMQTSNFVGRKNHDYWAMQEYHECLDTEIAHRAEIEEDETPYLYTV